MRVVLNVFSTVLKKHILVRQPTTTCITTAISSTISPQSSRQSTQQRNSMLLRKVQNILLPLSLQLSATSVWRAPHLWTAARGACFGFSPLCYLIKSCKHDTKMGAGKSKKEKRGRKRVIERDSTLCPSEIYKYTESIKP